MATKRNDEDPDDLPEHEESHPVGEHDGGGVTINLDELPADDGKAAKKTNGEDTEERQTRKGGEEREEDPDGALDALGEQESEEIRARRREERQQRKARRRERESQLESRLEQTENELRELRSRQAQGAAQDVRQTIERIEDEMRTLQAQYNEARSLKERAYNEQKGKEAVDADEAMAAARERYRALQGQRERIVSDIEEARTRPAPVSPQLKKHAEKFMADHEWYDIKGGDRDSAAVLAIDRQMARDGWDPNTAGYWEELAERVKEELPQRGEKSQRRVREREREIEDDDPPPRRRQITGGTDRDAPALKPNQYYVNAERVKALKEAGMWEDPAKRAKMIKIYKRRDEQEARQKRSR